MVEAEICPYYKMRRLDLLHNAAHCYKMSALLQNAAIVIRNCVTSLLQNVSLLQNTAEQVQLTIYSSVVIEARLSKVSGENKLHLQRHTRLLSRVPRFLFLPHFDVVCDLFLNRRTATWNLLLFICRFVNCIFIGFLFFCCTYTRL